MMRRHWLSAVSLLGSVSLGALSLGACSSSSDGSNGGGSSAGSGASTSNGGSGAQTAGNSSGGAGNAAGSHSSVGGAIGSAGSLSGSAGSTTSNGGSGVAGSTSSAGTGGTTASGGSTSTGGTTSAGGSGGSATGTKETVCNFASGLNIAWVNFANDVPNPNLTTFNTIFKNTHDAGGHIVRWWFHTNGTVTPGYDANGLAKPLQQSHIDGLKSILAAAYANGIGLNISLWSFDMLQDNAGAAHTNNQALLEKDANRQAYIDNYLTPLVKALKGTPGLYSYEIFNEPEGMTQSGWATYKTTEAFVQKTVNWFASAIHEADPNVLVTNGAVTFDYCSNVSGKTNYYSDAQLRSVGGKQDGILDFYEVHYYTQNGISNSAFQNPASHWALDKKLVMGEFFPSDTDGVAAKDLGTYLYTNGYNGGWSWSYDADQTWPAEQVPLQTLAAAQPSVANCPVAP